MLEQELSNEQPFSLKDQAWLLNPQLTYYRFSPFDEGNEQSFLNRMHSLRLYEHVKHIDIFHEILPEGSTSIVNFINGMPPSVTEVNFISDLVRTEFSDNLRDNQKLLYSSLPPTVTSLNFSPADFYQATEQEVSTLLKNIPSNVRSIGLHTDTYGYQSSQHEGFINECTQSKQTILRNLPRSITSVSLSLYDEESSLDIGNGIAEIPSSVTSLNFNGYLHNCNYRIDTLLRQIPQHIKQLDLQGLQFNDAGLYRVLYSNIPSHIETISLPAVIFKSNEDVHNHAEQLEKLPHSISIEQFYIVSGDVDEEAMTRLKQSLSNDKKLSYNITISIENEKVDDIFKQKNDFPMNATLSFDYRASVNEIISFLPKIPSSISSIKLDNQCLDYINQPEKVREICQKIPEHIKSVSLNRALRHPDQRLLSEYNRTGIPNAGLNAALNTPYNKDGLLKTLSDLPDHVDNVHLHNCGMTAKEIEEAVRQGSFHENIQIYIDNTNNPITRAKLIADECIAQALDPQRTGIEEFDLPADVSTQYVEKNVIRELLEREENKDAARLAAASIQIENLNLEESVRNQVRIIAELRESKEPTARSIAEEKVFQLSIAGRIPPDLTDELKIGIPSRFEATEKRLKIPPSDLHGSDEQSSATSLKNSATPTKQEASELTLSKSNSSLFGGSNESSSSESEEEVGTVASETALRVVSKLSP